MMHPLTKLAWLFVGGTIALAIIWALNNAEPEVQLACKQTDTSESRPTAKGLAKGDSFRRSRHTIASL